MDRLQNPYQPGAGTRPPALIGRDELIDGFGVALRRTLTGRSGKSCMLVGLRGVGKTVLLNRFAEIAEAEGVKVGFIEASENGDFRTLLAVRLRRILLEWNNRISRAVATALGVLKSFTLKLPGGASIAIGVDALAGRADSGLLAEDLTDLLVAAGEAAGTCDSGLVVAVDEVQYLSGDELAALVTAIHRTTQLGLPVLLTGAGLPQLPALVGAARSYAERLFEFPAVNSLPPEEAAAAIAVPAGELGVELTPGAVDRVVTESGGYPYFLQEWGYHVWNAAPANPITDDDVNAARVERHRHARPRLLPRPVRPVDTQGEGLPARDGGSRARSPPLGRHRGRARGQGRIGRTAPIRSHRQGHDLQPGARGHRVHGSAVRSVPAESHAGPLRVRLPAHRTRPEPPADDLGR